MKTQRQEGVKATGVCEDVSVLIWSLWRGAAGECGGDEENTRVVAVHAASFPSPRQHTVTVRNSAPRMHAACTTAILLQHDLTSLDVGQRLHVLDDPINNVLTPINNL
jgi:hypothetical protein